MGVTLRACAVKIRPEASIFPDFELIEKRTVVSLFFHRTLTFHLPGAASAASRRSEFMRLVALLLVLSASAAVYASSPAPPSFGAPSEQPSAHSIQGVVADPTGAIIPGAEIDLVDDSGSVAGTVHSGGDGSFQITAPHSGDYTLVVSLPGFQTVHKPVSLAAAASAAASVHTFTVPMHIVLPIAALATNVHVNADTSEDLTATDDNHDSSVLTTQDLKKLPIFDNDYATAMSAFLDDSASGTGGSGLIVDGAEANRATVSASAVQEVRINQDPYSARYYWPGRGQMEIVTKSAADHYHGEFNFLFRDSALNAQNALAPSKPFEQRRIYEGSLTGPIFFAPKSSFLVSFNRAEEDLNSVVDADVVPTTSNPSGILQANVPSPTRDTEYSIRAAHEFSDRNSGYAQYSYENWNGQNQGVGGQTLQQGGFGSDYHEDDVTLHFDSTLSAVFLNQLSVIGEHAQNSHNNTVEAPLISVAGYFSGGSAQNDYDATEYNFRLFDRVTWTHGRHLVQAGIGIPHIARRAYDDNTNSLGSYTFGPTVDSDGTVEATALDNFVNNKPSNFTQNTGDVHFIYHQQEMGAFIQDQWKISDSFAITPGVRYDWQNFLAAKRLGFSPRVSFAWVLDKDSKLVLRGGGGVYYDRFGSSPILDLVRYEDARRRSIQFSLDPSTEPATGCVPITDCETLSAQPANLAQLAPNAAIPYQMQYGFSIERQLGERATGVISVYSARGIHEFRSVDINAPTTASDYTERPDPNFGVIRQMQTAAFFEGNGLDISYRGRFNKYFTGFGRYTWSHYANNTGGIGWFPQNQYAPNNEWSNANWDRRQRLGMYAMINPESVFNISAGIFANSGRPWTVLTGTDPYGDGLFNARPDGVGRNTENNPSYVDMDLRWGHEFPVTGNKSEDAPRLGFNAGAFNLLNHENPSSIDPVITSPTFGQVTSVGSPRRLQLGMRFEF
jgi:Carboxypeptidase regulatory-like domain/TonB dependent receptor-like, beta-barrel